MSSNIFALRLYNASLISRGFPPIDSFDSVHSVVREEFEAIAYEASQRELGGHTHTGWRKLAETRQSIIHKLERKAKRFENALMKAGVKP